LAATHIVAISGMIDGMATWLVEWIRPYNGLN